MGNLAYEMLGRVTWFVGKRKVKSYFTSPARRRNRRIAGGAAVLVIGAIAAGAALSRSDAASA